MEVGELWNENSSDTGSEDTSVPIFEPIKRTVQLGLIRSYKVRII